MTTFLGKCEAMLVWVSPAHILVVCCPGRLTAIISNSTKHLLEQR